MTELKTDRKVSRFFSGKKDKKINYAARLVDSDLTDERYLRILYLTCETN